MRNTIYYGELERFGYTLTAVGKTREEVKSAILNEYIKAYKDWNNGYFPEGSEEFEHDYDAAREDLFTRELEFNKVEWF